MHALTLIDVRQAATDIQELTHAMSLALRALVAHGRTEKTQLVLLMSAAELASDKATLIVETATDVA